MKKSLFLTAAIALLTTAGAIALSNPQQSIAGGRQSRTRAEVIANGAQLRLTAQGQTQIIDADRLNVRVLNGLNCEKLQLEPEQVLNGQRFHPSVGIDAQTGNVAVGVILQECVETQLSAVFVIDPQGSGHALYRVQVPGETVLQDEFTTYPLKDLIQIGYLGRDLLVKHGDASGSSSILVFTPSNTPAGQYAGCVYTEIVEGTSLCPPESVAN
ncbi:MAG: hypothetical protein Fur0046_22740 [Cyanobacteria bacterium J069]